MENENALTVLPFSTPVGLNLPPDFSIVAWAGYARAIKIWDVAGQFFLGDLMLYAQNKGKDYDEEATQIVANLRFEPKTLQNAMYMAKRFPTALRRTGVDYSLYREVASLPTGQAMDLIGLAVEGEWSVRELKAEIRNRKNGANAKVAEEAVDVSNDSKNCPTVGQNAELSKPYGTISGRGEPIEEADEVFPSEVPPFCSMNNETFFNEQDLVELESEVEKGEHATKLEVQRLVTDLRRARYERDVFRVALIGINVEIQAICESPAEMAAEDIQHLTAIAEIIEVLGLEEQEPTNAEADAG